MPLLDDAPFYGVDGKPVKPGSGTKRPKSERGLLDALLEGPGLLYRGLAGQAAYDRLPDLGGMGAVGMFPAGLMAHQLEQMMRGYGLDRKEPRT